MTQQQPKNPAPVLLSLEPSPRPLPVQMDLYCHLSPIIHPRLRPCRLSRVADHADCLPGMSLQDHIVKQADQGAKISLESLRISRCNNDIVRTEMGILMPTLLYTLAPLFCTLHHQVHPVKHYRIHHHVENDGV